MNPESNPESNAQSPQRRRVSYLFMLMGIAVIVVALFGNSQAAPAWVVVLAGVAMLGGGLAGVLGTHGHARGAAYAAALFPACGAVISLWFALTPGAVLCEREFLGVITTVSGTECRIAFGFAALICALLTWLFLRAAAPRR